MGKTTTYNLGLDFEIFKNSIVTGSIDVYKRKTSDLLSKVPSPPGQGTGGTEFIKNVGSLEGSGFEFNTNVKVIRTDSFSLNLGGNIAYNFSTIKDLGGAQTVQDTGSGLNQTGVYLAQNHIGEQPYSAYVFEQIYDAHGQPIVGAYVDRNGDGKIDNADKYYKALRPNWTYGFNTNISYKNFDLTANFRGQIGGQIYNLKRLTNGYTDSGLAQNANSLNNV